MSPLISGVHFSFDTALRAKILSVSPLDWRLLEMLLDQSSFLADQLK